MSTNHYNIGYAFFKANGEQTDEFIKQQHAVWRAGYNAALTEERNKHSPSVPMELYNVPKKPGKYVPTDKDILTATRNYRYRRLHTPCMKPVLRALIKSIENNMDQINTVRDLNEMVKAKFELLLQAGVELGVLTSEDVAYHSATTR